jgi:hypothetical protein
LRLDFLLMNFRLVRHWKAPPRILLAQTIQRSLLSS